jgi:hypothetical protein
MNYDYSVDGRRRAGKFYSATGESMANPESHDVDPKFAEIFAAQAKLVFAEDAGQSQTDAIKKRDDLIHQLSGEERNQIRMIAASLEVICARPRTVA